MIHFFRKISPFTVHGKHFYSIFYHQFIEAFIVITIIMSKIFIRVTLTYVSNGMATK